MSNEISVPKEIQAVLDRLNESIEWEENLSPDEEDQFARLLAQSDCGDIIVILEDGTQRREPPGPDFKEHEMAARLGFEIDLDLKTFRFIAKPSQPD